MPKDPPRLRVLFLNWRDTGHPEGGGSERYVQQVAEGLLRDAHDVTLRCPRYEGARREEDVGGVRVVRHGGRFTVYPRSMLHLLVRPRRYDVVVDVQNGVPFWSRLVTRTPVIVLVHHVHRNVWPVVFGRCMARLGWWLESRVAPHVYANCRYATVSAATGRDLEELGVDAGRITLVRNGADAPAQPPETVARTPWPSMIVLGRLVPHKRVELAIEALEVVRGEFPDATLTVVGQGYWEPRLRALAERLGISDAVTFTGFVDDATKSRLLAQSWVHVMPSVKEGWGLAVMDAAMCGTPSVAFRSAGGTSESIVHGATGLLLGDDEPLQDRIAALLRSPDLCVSLGARARAYAATFTWEATAERFGQLARLAVDKEPAMSVPEAPVRLVPLQRPRAESTPEHAAPSRGNAR